MNPLLFCPNAAFEHEVINILNSHLFRAPLQGLPEAYPTFNNLEEIYADMRNHINCSGYNLYHADGNCLIKDNRQKQIYFGHDLPIWLNNYEKADFKLMIVGECPRRGVNEMYEKSYSTPQLSISSPFGIHSTYWRRGKDGIVPQVLEELIEHVQKKCDKVLSVYLTDAFKLCHLKNHVPLKQNKVYKAILCEEIKLYQPDFIIALGGAAKKQLDQAIKLCPCLNGFGNKTATVKHPSRRNGTTKTNFKERIIEEINNSKQLALCIQKN